MAELIAPFMVARVPGRSLNLNGLYDHDPDDS